MRLVIPGATEILIGRGLPDPLLPERARSAVLLISQPAAQMVTDRIIPMLPGVTAREVPAGESAKSLRSLETIYHELDRAGVRRDGAIVAVGGGTITDVAGFAAATWLRGIEAIFVPTTLLGAVDAAIGGKTGINFEGKNLVGAFWHPSRVIIDLDVLETLPSTVAREGWAEIIKAGLLADPQLIEAIEEDGLATDIQEAVTRAVRVKVDVVSRDFREAGVRAHLNLGHTIGHAIESATGMSHGEAVGLGLIAEAAAARVDRGFPGEERVKALVARVGLPTRLDAVDPAELGALMAKDKKADAHGIRMVLLDDIGTPVLARPSLEALDAAWAAIGA